MCKGIGNKYYVSKICDDAIEKTYIHHTRASKNPKHLRAQLASAVKCRWKSKDCCGNHCAAKKLILETATYI